MNEADANVWATTMVDQALAKVLGTLLGVEAPLVLSYGTNHEKLWELENEDLKTRLDDASRNGLILIWDGQKGSSTVAGRNTTEYLNPLTWALCATRKYPSLQITIVDCDANKHATGKFYQMLQVIDPAQRPFRLITNPSCCVADILAHPNQPPATSTTAKDLLATRLKSLLTERGKESDHHALANIVGPLILLGNKLTCDADAGQRALYTLFREVGLVGAADESLKPEPPLVSGNALSEATESTAVEDELPVRLLLVDDQYSHGWDKWVTSMVAHDPSYKLEATASPDILIDSINEGLAKGDKDLDYRFRLSFPPTQPTAAPIEDPVAQGKVTKKPACLTSFDELAAEIPRPPAEEPYVETILLLDLRLFSLRPVQEEAEFIRKKLLPLCKKFAPDDDSSPQEKEMSLPWPGFSTEEIQCADKWCANPRRETDEYLLVLSMLPKLVSLVDFSLPIILFSSTGQRRIIELLKPYGNIITSFEKPRFTGLEGAELVSETETRFYSALKRASAFVRAAQKIRALRALPLTQYNEAKAMFKGKRHIEIFHDESSDSGSPYFRVAAFAVGFDSMEDANKTDSHIHTNGPRFFGPNPLEKITEPDAAETQWKYQVAPALAEGLKAGQCQFPYILPFMVVSGEWIQPRADTDQFSLLDPSGLDNTNQELFRLLLEVMLVDVLAWVTSDLPECCVFGATRMRRQSSEKEPDCGAIKEELYKRWRINTEVFPDYNPKSRKWSFRWQSLRLDSLHAFLNEMASARSRSEKGSAFAAGISRAFCTTLPDEKTMYAPPGYSYLHSVADPIARLGDIDLKLRAVTWKRTESSEHLPLGLRGIAGIRDQVVRVINCHRALDEGDLVDGFGYGLGVNHEHDVAGNIVAMRMRDLIHGLTGDDFVRIVNHVAEGGPRWTHSPRLHGRQEGNRSNKPAASIMPETRAEDIQESTSIWYDPRNQWRVRTFKREDEYLAAGISWDDGRKGFLVRRSSTGRVNVFADLTQTGEEELDGFVVPFTKTLFLPDGSPCGKPWSPNRTKVQ